MVRASAQRLVDLANKVEDEFEIRMLVTALDSKFGVTKESFIGSDELLLKTDGALNFCGYDAIEGKRWNFSVKEADRVGLKISLQDISHSADKLVKQAIERSDNRKKN